MNSSLTYVLTILDLMFLNRFTGDNKITAITLQDRYLYGNLKLFLTNNMWR